MYLLRIRLGEHQFILLFIVNLRTDGTRFRGAYCTIFEGDPLTDIFGEMDIIADSLPELADHVIANESA